MRDFVCLLMRVFGLSCSLLLIFLLSISTSGAAQFGTGVFPNAQDIEKVLVRGKSTRADVQKLLGIPTGAGGALLPGFGENSEIVEPYDIWYYEDIETGNFKSKDGVLIMGLRQQILMIFFKGDKFHGYFWTTNKDDVR
jgi:outer membrane protein assembly factor BamE (lipoprotein component of BamABCDE complex)